MNVPWDNRPRWLEWLCDEETIALVAIAFTVALFAWVVIWAPRS